MKRNIALLSAIMFSMLSNPGLSNAEKLAQSHEMNKQSGGLLFSAGPQPKKTMNQRQRRKLARQNPHSKWAKM